MEKRPEIIPSVYKYTLSWSTQGAIQVPELKFEKKESKVYDFLAGRALKSSSTKSVVE